LPLGAGAGHKGFALSLLVEILGSALAGIGPTDPHVKGNGVCFLVIDPAAFCPLETFRRLMDETVAYMKSSPPVPGVAEVMVPGELEFRTMRRRKQEGIPVDEATRNALQEYCQKWKVEFDL
jgi:LDH2 family malate/lactate/ureidoglycolate dehydrogenase